MITDRLVLGIHDNYTRVELLKARKLTLTKCIDICRAAESVWVHNKMLQSEVVHVVKEKDRRSGEKDRKMLCKLCNYKHVMRTERCPAYGKKCEHCGEPNHFESKCP